MVQIKQLLLFCATVTTFLLSGCQSPSPKSTLKIAATAVPHAELLEEIKPDLKKEGIHLDIIIVEDFVTPNRALAEKEVDANFFQTEPFLATQMKEFGYPLEILGAVHLEPMGLYSKKLLSLDEVKKGSKIAVPHDPSNQARALALLEEAHLIGLNNHTPQASLQNINSNPLELHFIEMDAALLPRTLQDVELAAINANFALQAGLSPLKDALLIESIGETPFVNVVVVRKGDKSKEEMVKLIDLLQSQKIRTFILERYKGAIIPAF